ncbi:MAG: XdhC family protein, partial [Candidatus Dormiibacterota bacterium]
MPSVEEELARRISQGEEVLLATVIRLGGEPPSQPGAKLLTSRTATLAGTLGCSEFDAAALADANGIAETGTPVLRTYRHELGSIEVYLEPHAPAPTLVVFGATPVARSLLRLAPEAGFRTVLVETRRERLTGADWPVAVGSLDDLQATFGSEVYAVHTDHDAEDLVQALEALLPGEPRFIGLVGSRRHTGHHLEALR